ncbi:MAG: type II secretion system protein GspG [Myxococcales bacterium]
MPRQSRKRSQPRGFTLLELMVAITIIALVTGVAAVGVMDALRNARIQTTKTSMVSIEEALKLYSVKHGRYPSTEQGLAILLSERLLDKNKKNTDGWGHDFAYVGEKDHYVLTSYGDDGESGGEEAAADIVVEGGR